MAWFERSAGGRKGSEGESAKIAQATKPMRESGSAATVPEPVPSRPIEVASPSSAGLVGYLHKGSRVSGQLSFQGPARIDGIVEGDIQCKGPLTVGESADIRAKISGQVIVISGRVEGDVTGKERVELLAPARLIGDIATPRLIIAEGVVFDGDCSMGAAAERLGVAGTKSVSVDRAAAGPSPKLQAESKT
jgi:cytoskeletal protein CcmA (bactofilin family)